MKIGFAQINPTVGDLKGNFEKIAAAYDRLDAAGADLVLTPELATTGYPPQDLVFKSQFVPQNLEILGGLARTYGRPIFYCNAVGGNDQLVFDGNSIAFNDAGELLAQLAAFREDEAVVDVGATPIAISSEDAMDELFGALSLGLRD